MKARSLAIPLSLIVLVSVSCQHTPAPKDRVETLLAQMTLEEKIGQMNQLSGGWISPDLCAQIRNGQVGSMLNSVDYDEIMRYQHLAVDSSRLGIPLLFARDIIHGFRTIYPIPLGQAATWNPSLVERAARLTAQEATQTGIRWTFSPMVDVCRDPRWGRVAEGYGEDTYLTSQMGVAAVLGYQGDSIMIPNDRLAACVKHFAAYGASESGRDYNTTWVPEVLLRDVYLPPFKRAVEVNVASVMCSFNDICGVPSSANKHLNRDLLRTEWQYEGLLESDWWSSANMVPHGYAQDLEQASLQSISAGMDMDMEGHGYIQYLASFVQEGKIQESQIDEAVRRILRLKERLGLFDDPFTAVPNPQYYTPEALLCATQAVEESAILLKNDGILPLKNMGAGKTILVCGPLANAPKEQLGTWCFDGSADHAVTPLQALQKHCQGCHILYEPFLAYSRDTVLAPKAKVVEQARKADFILFFGGEEAILSGEARCRADISLPGAQTALLEYLYQSGKPVVTVIMAGRPLTLGKETALSNALLYSFHGGTMAGEGLARVLTGEVSPSGRLPITMPQMVGQIPIYYNRKNTGRPTSNPVLLNAIPVGAPQFSLGESSYWLECGDRPLFPFGYGLTYTTFAYSQPVLSDTLLHKGDTLHIACTLTNTGTCTAAEVAQLYVRDLVGDCRPVRELKGFTKITLAPGESQTVHFDLTADDLAYWHTRQLDPFTQQVYSCADPGDFQLFVAPNSESGTPVTFTLQ